MTTPLEPARSLLQELVSSASRDLVTFADATDPNRRSAGEAALRGLNAVIRCASRARDKLLAELHDATGQPLGRDNGGRGNGGRF